jgi:hypothetical protein
LDEEGEGEDRQHDEAAGGMQRPSLHLLAVEEIQVAATPGVAGNYS